MSAYLFDSSKGSNRQRSVLLKVCLKVCKRFAKGSQKVRKRFAKGSQKVCKSLAEGSAADAQPATGALASRFYPVESN